MNELISVIIPVYNAEKYLREALEDVRQQTYKNIEIICIDDCSTDSSNDILREYQQKDEKFRIFRNQERQGAAISRNICIDKAQGEYICFVDADDVCHRDMLQELYSAAEKMDADVSICEWDKITDQNIYSSDEKFRSYEYKEKYCHNVFSVDDYNLLEMLDMVSISPWAKLFRREFIISNSLIFQDLESSNDVYFAIMSMGVADRIVHTDTCKALYGNRIHNSNSRISYHRNPHCAYEAAIKILDEMAIRNIKEIRYEYFSFCIICVVIMALYVNITFEEKKSYYLYLKNYGADELMDKLKKVIHNNSIDILESLLNIKSNQYDINRNLVKELHEKALKVSLYKNKEYIIQLFQKLKKESKKVGLWGMGFRGKIFYDFVSNLGIEINYLGDSDSENKNYKGNEIVGVRCMVEMSDVIIISIGQLTSAEVWNAIGNDKKEVYDIHELPVVKKLF